MSTRHQGLVIVTVEQGGAEQAFASTTSSAPQDTSLLTQNRAFHAQQENTKTGQQDQEAASPARIALRVDTEVSWARYGPLAKGSARLGTPVLQGPKHGSLV